MTVFDAANDPKKQFAQLQTAVTSRQYDGIIVQPIFGTGALPGRQAGDRGRNQGREHGPDPRPERRHREAAGRRVSRATSSSCRPTSGRSRAGSSSQACKAQKLEPVQRRATSTRSRSRRSTPRSRKGFDEVIKGHPIKVVAEGETFYSPAQALKAAQTMLQARSGHQPHRRCRPGRDRARSRRSAERRSCSSGTAAAESASRPSRPAAGSARSCSGRQRRESSRWGA